jgi:radical S-adenosyl methionine domain-containing protein 2
MFPRAINFHLLRACNARCRYCFARFPETPNRLATADAFEVMRRVREAGGEKMNFVGGEPTLHPDIERLVVAAREMGFTTSIVSNGAQLARLLASSGGAMLDWVGLSVDSTTDEGNALVGRGGPGYTAQVVAHAEQARANGAAVKLNTVVTRYNVHEDMSALVRAIAPERWKVFQVLRVEGQNENSVDDLLVEAREFQEFVARHHVLHNEGIPVVAENNDAMTDSYAMIDPMGRFFGNTGGVHRVGLSILQAGAVEALASVGFDSDKLAARGGVYAWERRRLRLLAG